MTQSVDLPGYPQGKKGVTAIAIISHLLQVLLHYAKYVTILFQGFSPLLLEKERGLKFWHSFQSAWGE